MQCNHCGKIVPNTTKICMFCNNEIDPNGHYIDPVEDLGSVDNVDLENGSKLQVVNDLLKKPANKKYIFAGVGIIILIIIVIIVIAVMSFSGGNVDGTSYFLGVSDKVYEMLDEDIFYKNGHTGSASVELTVNDERSYYADGSYVFDPIKDYFSYDGEFDGDYSTSDIRMDTAVLPYSFILNENNLYFTSASVNESSYSVNLSNLSSYFNFGDYDITKIASEVHDALDTTLNNMSIDTEKVSLNFRGNDISAYKASLVLDSEGKREFLNIFMNELIDSSRFVNELAAIRDEKKDETKQYLTDLLKTLEYKYSDSNKDVLTISIYVSDGSVVKIEAINKSDDTSKYQLEIDGSKYYFDYFKNDKNIYSGSYVRTTKELAEKIHGEIDITFDSDEFLTDLVIKYDDDNKPKYSKTSVDNSIDFSTLSDEDYELFKNTLKEYSNGIDYLDGFRNMLLSDCNSDLTCNCSDKTCVCQLEEDKYITCPIGLIKK